MGRLLVASQLDAAFNDAIAGQVSNVEIISAPRGVPSELPSGAEVLVAAPFRRAGGPLTARPPVGWPFDLRWVQLVSVGVLGEYIGRIYEQTRGTPRYVVVERAGPAPMARTYESHDAAAPAAE